MPAGGFACRVSEVGCRVGSGRRCLVAEEAESGPRGALGCAKALGAVPTGGRGNNRMPCSQVHQLGQAVARLALCIIAGVRGLSSKAQQAQVEGEHDSKAPCDTPHV